MKKNNLRRKKYFSIKFLLFAVLIIFIGMSSSYAIITQKLSIKGDISGEAVFTYYFNKPSDWNGSNMHAYIWVNNGGEIAAWPGLAMSYVTTNNSTDVYKIEVTSDMAYYTDHNFIIFNDGSNQTINIQLNRFENNNQIFTVGGDSEKQILAWNRFTSWGDGNVYAYLWNSSTGENIANWPGVDITSNIISENLYGIEIEKGKYDRIIFNINGNNTKQTDDLTINFSDDERYDGSWHSITAGHWSNYIQSSNLTSSHTNN